MSKILIRLQVWPFDVHTPRVPDCFCPTISHWSSFIATHNYLSRNASYVKSLCVFFLEPLQNHDLYLFPDNPSSTCFVSIHEQLNTFLCISFCAIAVNNSCEHIACKCSTLHIACFTMLQVGLFSCVKGKIIWIWDVIETVFPRIVNLNSTL